MTIMKIGVLGLDESIRIIFRGSWRLVSSLFNASLDELSKENIGMSGLRTKGLGVQGLGIQGLEDLK